MKRLRLVDIWVDQHRGILLQYIWLEVWYDTSSFTDDIKDCLVQVGIGAFVLNSKREVLVVQERFGPLKGTVCNLHVSVYVSNVCSAYQQAVQHKL